MSSSVASSSRALPPRLPLLGLAMLGVRLRLSSVMCTRYRTALEVEPAEGGLLSSDRASLWTGKGCGQAR